MSDETKYKDQLEPEIFLPRKKRKYSLGKKTTLVVSGYVSKWIIETFTNNLKSLNLKTYKTNFSDSY